MRVLGVDLATQPAGTGLIVLTASAGGRWRAATVAARADDDLLVELARDVTVIGVDAPLGWPTGFTAAIAAHHRNLAWPAGTDRTTLTHRDTDRVVHAVTGRLPLSVSADKLGSTAMRCAWLQHRWGTEVWSAPAPRDGSGPLVETYPAAALRTWGLPAGGYKNGPAAPAVRSDILRRLGAATGAWLDLTNVGGSCERSDHVLDALVSALVALAAVFGQTRPPQERERQRALTEGWIHLPTGELGALTPP